MHTMILSFEGKRFRVFDKDLHYLLVMLDANGNRPNDSLYEQDFNKENFLGGLTFFVLKKHYGTKDKRYRSFRFLNLKRFWADLKGDAIL